MVAEPGPGGVEGDDERVRVLEFQQDPVRPGAARQQIGQLAVDPVEQAGAQQQVLHIAGLAVQHFGEQVLRDRAVGAGEVGDETLRVGVTGQGEHREPQARGPSFGPLVQQRHPGVRQLDTRGGEKLAGFVFGEPQIRRADLGELTRQAQLMKAQRADRGGSSAARARRRAGSSATG